MLDLKQASRAFSQYLYRYDGSFDGLLSLVFDAFNYKEIPLTVVKGNDGEITLLPERTILADAAKAKRVLNGIKEKIGREAYENVRSVFLANFPDKEIALIRYLKKGFEVGQAVNSLLSHNEVKPFLKGIRALYKERVRFIEFLRFSDYDGKLIAEFEPEHYSLPLIGPHFVERFPCETFMIYDKTHGLAFIYADKKAKIIPADEIYLPQLSEEEKKYRTLWKMFYKTVAIEERKNERLRMGLMPKKFWKHMTEMMEND